jgi:hypothetical protein
MSRPRKLVSEEALRRAYSEQGLSTTEIADRSASLLGVSMTSGTVYNYLVRFGILPRSKSLSVSMSRSKVPCIRLVDVVGRNTSGMLHWNPRYWNARWFISTGKVESTCSMLTRDQAELLKEMLDRYGDRPAFPDDMVESAFKDIRKKGFPYITLDPEEQCRAWKRLLAACPKKKDGRYHWIGTDTTLATMFHPHIYECRKNGKMSPMELFNDDDGLKRVIRKVLCLYGKITDRLINDICRNEDAAGRVGNFPPRVGKAIINELWPGDHLPNVLDPCSGFSGRLISCACSGKVSRYVGFDLSVPTYHGLLKTREFLSKVSPMRIEDRKSVV